MAMTKFFIFFNEYFLRFFPQDIKSEQSLLSWEGGKFPALHQLLTQKEPYDTLWRTSLTFHKQHDIWLDGAVVWEVGGEGDVE